MDFKNLKEMLQSGATIKAGQTVACKLVTEMNVWGFVPQKKDCSDLDLNMADIRVLHNRLQVEPVDSVTNYGGVTVRRMHSYRIYKSIRLAGEAEEKLPLREIRVTRLEGIRNYDINQSNGGRPDLIKDARVSVVEEDDKKVGYYQPAEGEVLMYDESRDDVVKATADSFLVVCNRINTVTGRVVYELYSAEDLCLA